MKSRPTVLKLGGSVITAKDKPFTSKTKNIVRLAKEIKESNINPLVLVHGGGSWGHPTAKKFRIKEGYKKQSQVLGFSKTHHAMVSLNKIVLNALIVEGVAAMTIQPSAFITTNNGRIQKIGLNTINLLFNLGITPVLYGDAVLDSILGFTILSGDQLAATLAVKLGANRVIIGVDVDGLHTTDPKIDHEAELISHITLNEFESMKHKIGKTKVTDVTGGMLGKMIELQPAVSQGIRAIIINASKPNNVYKALIGKKIKGTIFEAIRNVA